MIAQVSATVKKILREYEALLNEDAAKQYLYLEQLTILDFILAQQLIATNFV